MSVETTTNQLGNLKLAKIKFSGRPDTSLGSVTHHNVEQLRKLNQAIFPINYNDKFYTGAYTSGEMCKLAYYNSVVVGAVCCRLDTHEGEKCIYIMTLGTLAAYRLCGIGKCLLDHVFKIADKAGAKYIALHVQTNNETALDFYKHQGFKESGVEKDYYRIEPSDAYYLVKQL